MIAIQFDGNYLHWGTLLLRSLALHEPRKRVVADTIGLSREQAAAVRAAHPRVIHQDRPAPAGGTSRDSMVNEKVWFLRQVAGDYPREPWYCLFDADLLVRRPLAALWSCMRWAEVGIVTNPRAAVHTRVWGSLVLFRREGRALLDNWAREYSTRAIGGFRPGQFFFDQASLAVAVERTPVRYARIPQAEYLDHLLREDSSIWSAHVALEEKDRAYRCFLAGHERQLREARGPDRRAAGARGVAGALAGG